MKSYLKKLNDRFTEIKPLKCIFNNIIKYLILYSTIIHDLTLDADPV